MMTYVIMKRLCEAWIHVGLTVTMYWTGYNPVACFELCPFLQLKVAVKFMTRKLNDA